MDKLSDVTNPESSTDTSPRGDAVAKAAANAYTMRVAVEGNRVVFHDRRSRAQPVQPHRKVRRNDPCTCGSGIKFKKCCLAVLEGRGRDPFKLPRPLVEQSSVRTLDTNTDAPATRQVTAMALVQAKVAPRIVWAYLETGLFITELNKAAHSPEARACWEKSLVAYDNATEDERRVMLAEILTEKTDECGSDQLSNQVDSPGGESTQPGK